jgi:osmotically-inducible protein OsmY
MNRRFFLSLVVPFVVAGCAQQSQRPAAPPLRAMGQSIAVEEEHSDEAIGLEIRRRMQSEAPAETASVIVNVSDGVVALEGSAPSLQASWRAQAVANAVKGVKRVVNKLFVTAPTPPAP